MFLSTKYNIHRLTLQNKSAKKRNGGESVSSLIIIYRISYDKSQS